MLHIIISIYKEGQWYNLINKFLRILTKKYDLWDK